MINSEIKDENKKILLQNVIITDVYSHRYFILKNKINIFIEFIRYMKKPREYQILMKQMLLLRIIKLLYILIY